MTLLEEQTTPAVSQTSTSQVENQETPVVEDQTDDAQVDETGEDGQTSQQSQTGDDQTDEGQQQHEEERKPTRAEKRLHQVLNKGKQNQSPLATLSRMLPPIEPDENGYYTPQQVKQIAANAAIEAVELDKDIRSYQENTEGFISEIEEVGTLIEQDFKDNPELAQQVNSILTKQLQAANLRTDARGNQILVPVQNPKELYEQLKVALKLTTTQGTEQATASLARQIAEGAITPSNAQGGGQAPLTTLQKNLWNNPGKVAAELAKRLPRSD